MSKFNENFTKAIKYLILSSCEKISSIKKTQNDQIQNIIEGKDLESFALEEFKEDNFCKKV